VIGNTGSNSTREAIHATEQGFAVGMHAALHINPYYGKTSLEGLRMHFKSVLEFGPTVVYNVPARTGQDLPTSFIEVSFEPVVAVILLAASSMIWSRSGGDWQAGREGVKWCLVARYRRTRPFRRGHSYGLVAFRKTRKRV
jgi:hypothetical protein